MSLEAREAEKKNDPNYDAFEFDDDDDFGYGGAVPEPRKKEAEPLKKVEVPKAKYIPGVGFEVQGMKEHQKRWQPKNLPPPVVLDTLNDKTYYTSADKIRTQRDEELTSWWMKPEQSNSTECAKNLRRATKEQPALPKFIIRIEKLHTHTTEPVATRKKYKRKNLGSDNEDSDYDDVSYRKRKITKKVYSLQRVDGAFRKTVLDFQIGPHVPEADRRRINAFGPAEGILPKGTYVVCKADILRDDCAVWRVDNQNLLQKFPQMRNPKTNKLVYRSSSTYSGWCEQISYLYFRVSVRIIKQTRSETTVEPEIPLAEMFPASSVEWFKHPGTVNFRLLAIPTTFPDLIEEDPQWKALNTLLNACLGQVFVKKHIEMLVEKKDYTFIRSLEVIERQSEVCAQMIKKRIPVEMKHNKWIGTYTRYFVSRNSYHSLSKCQICKRKKPRRTIHFYDKTFYNMNLVVENLVENIRDPDAEDRDCPIVADAISCGRCAMAMDFLHSMHHLKFHMLRSCESKLEEIGTPEIELSNEKIIEAAKADKIWMKRVVQKYLDIWEIVRMEWGSS